MADAPGEIETKERDGRDRRSRKSATHSPNESLDSTPSTPRSRSGTPPLRFKRSAESSPSPAPSLSNLSLSKLPQRPGIFWRAGNKVEAKDFMGKWYLARIIEVDELAQEVHIHFEGWNSRYDEILSMESDRLRAAVRHSERKERTSTRSRTASRPEHKVNECVFAKWTDCRLYAARILAVNSNGSYEVLFYDGFKKTVQPINVKTMSAEVQAEYQKAGILPPPIKKFKLKGSPTGTGRRGEEEESEEGSKERGASDNEGHKKSRRERSERDSSSAPSEPVEEQAGPSKPKKRTLESTTPTGPPRKKSKLLIGGIFKAKKKDKDFPRSADSPATSVSGSEPKSPQAKDSCSSSSSVKDEPCEEMAPTTEIPSGAPESDTAPISAPPASSTPQPDVMAEVGGATTLDTCQSSQHSQSAAPPVQPGTLPVLPPGYEFHTARGMDGTRAKYPEKSKVTFSRNPSTSKTSGSVWAPKEFKIENDHNQFKCPWNHCPKGFRKRVLLESHLKHYHNEDGTRKPPPPPRLRKKTVSVCSTDSDISVGGKSTGSRSRRQSQLSISSMPEVSQDGSMGSVEDDPPVQNESLTMVVDEKPEILIPQEPVAMEITGFGSQRGTKTDEVVNCICQINEENGLMIQCEVCLCWQHAMCMEITEETLPKKYICYICQHPPGVRENAKYMHVQDWHREGVMPCYGFLPPVPENERRSPSVVQGTHDLVGDMHNIHRVLHALRKELHSVNTRDQSELQLWTKNWDREAKIVNTDVGTPGVKVESLDFQQVAAHVKLENTEMMAFSSLVDPLSIKAENDMDKQKLIDSIRSRFNLDEDPAGSDRVDDDTDEERTDGEKEESGETTDEAEETLRHEAALRELELKEQELKSAGMSRGMSQSSSATELHDYFGSADIKQNTLSAARSTLSAIGRAASSESTDDLESDVSLNQADDDPFANCERHLLEHVMMMQDNVESRMDSIEDQVAALEALTPANHGRDVLTEVPNLKRLIHQLITDLDKVKRMARYH